MKVILFEDVRTKVRELVADLTLCENVKVALEDEEEDEKDNRINLRIRIEKPSQVNNQKTTKEHKALEIIKEKNVDIVGIKKLSLEDYNKGVELGDEFKPKEMKEYPYKKLTQEEYDLLKEVWL